MDEAKNSLHQIKQDSLDTTVFTNRMIETFGSVSPSRKRRSYSFNSPRLKGSRKSLFESTSPPSVNLESTPACKDKDADPMSMTDDEFNSIFLSNKTTSPDRTSSFKKKDYTKKVTYEEKL